MQKNKKESLIGLKGSFSSEVDTNRLIYLERLTIRKTNRVTELFAQVMKTFKYMCRPLYDFFQKLGITFGKKHEGLGAIQLLEEELTHKIERIDKKMAALMAHKKR